MKKILLALSLGIFTLAANTAQACGRDSDCSIGDRTYRVALPASPSGKIGAIIFNHGYQGRPERVMRNKRLVKAVTDMGLAFVSPKSAFGDWDIPNSPSQKDGTSEYPFFDKLKTDLVAKHGIDPDRIMITGFSAGGMMTWELACRRGNLFAAFAPIAGTFWDPVPKSCETLPQPIIHTHGTADRTVPLAGRAIGETKQGDVNEALELAVPVDEYGDWIPIGKTGRLTCEKRQKTDTDFLQFCLHSGGHSIRAPWVVRAWNEFEKAGVL